MVRISVGSQIGELIDDFLEENKDKDATDRTVEKLCQNLIKKLDKQPSEYISDFKYATKAANESHSAYAHRLKKLFKKGTENTGKMGQGECRLLVEQFLEGLPHSEATTLKLVANDDEMLDVDLLALRASRSGKPRKPVNSLSKPNSPESQPETTENTTKPADGNVSRRGARFNCHYCHKFGHPWRSCFKRARENPNWRPLLHQTDSDANNQNENDNWLDQDKSTVHISNVSNTTNLPFITIEFCPEYAPARQTVFLLDSGASVNCLRYCESLVACDSLRILPSRTFPVGASGASLQNAGDCYGTLTFPDGTSCRERFTLIRDLPFNGIIGINLLTNRNFQLLEDGINIKLGNEILPRVFGPDTIMTIKDGQEQFSCESKSLSCSLIDALSVKLVIDKMVNDLGSAQTKMVKIPNPDTEKPQCSFLCPIFSLPTDTKQRRKTGKEEVTPSKHVGESKCQDSASSNADLEVSLDSNQNVRNLLEAIKLQS